MNCAKGPASTRFDAQWPRRITGSALKLTLVNGVVVDVAFSGLFEWGELGGVWGVE